MPLLTRRSACHAHALMSEVFITLCVAICVSSSCIYRFLYIGICVLVAALATRLYTPLHAFIRLYTPITHLLHTCTDHLLHACTDSSRFQLHAICRVPGEARPHAQHPLLRSHEPAGRLSLYHRVCVCVCVRARHISSVLIRKRQRASSTVQRLLYVSSYYNTSTIYPLHIQRADAQVPSGPAQYR